VTVLAEKNCLMISLEDRLQLTVVPGRVAHFYTDIYGFSFAQYTQLCYLIVSLKMASSNQTVKNHSKNSSQ
jgi:hypothetical protein